MRPGATWLLGFVAALLTACARTEPRGRSVGALHVEGAAATASAKSVDACSAGQALAEGELRFGAADVFDRARLAAFAFDADVIVVGDAGTSHVWAALAGIDAGVSFGKLPDLPRLVRARSIEQALNSAWPTTQRHGIFVQDVRGEPRGTKDAAAVTVDLSGLPEGDAADVDIAQVAARDFFWRFARGMGLEARASASGTLTIAAWQVPQGRVLRVLGELSGDASFDGRVFALGPKASFGETRAAAADPCKTREGAQHSCTPAKTMHVIGVARAPGRDAVALIGHQLDEQVHIVGLLVRSGDRLGSDALAVAEVSCAGVRLADGTALALR